MGIESSAEYSIPYIVYLNAQQKDSYIKKLEQ